jgi:signal transduction histidine kinase
VIPRSFGGPRHHGSTRAATADRQTRSSAVVDQQTELLHEKIAQAREEERKRVARELHDQIIQALIGVSYHLTYVQNQGSSAIDLQLAQVQVDLRHILDDIRRICAHLRPAPREGPGLLANVRAHVGEIQARHPLRITLHVTGDTTQPVPEDAELCLLRVLQVALSNVLQHAAASEAVVSMEFRPQEICMTISDNGRGFVVPIDLECFAQKHRFGLLGAHERLALIAGTFRVASSPRNGTTLSARVPICNIKS